MASFSNLQDLSLLVFSGGTAFNSVAEELSKQNITKVAHVLPVSDDGGSTAEVLRVLGGPAVGDIRSRCLRLSDESDEEAKAVKELLAHRLHPTDSAQAKSEWYQIIEGNHPLWDPMISQPYADTIRSFLVHFHSEVLRASPTSNPFDYVNGSIGNFFFAGARSFFHSIEASIFLYSRVSRIPTDSLVLPCITENHAMQDDRITIAAELRDGSIIRGQNQISHPTPDAKAFRKTAEAATGLKLTDEKFWEKFQLGSLTSVEFWGGLERSSR
ncbi:hypothetical protein CYMTET_36636 [Cymbomonas tetramitiformis]|uniref:Uncharacterized protein n=1 Tax=Cymbomonas tetramitiformis TaxID=36881 RepID=A0AAE0CFL9_9CHLO|nr:hypothetical protein CYMTET_36636 [Cymbomonas tetramitiformis]